MHISPNEVPSVSSGLHYIRHMNIQVMAASLSRTIGLRIGTHAEKSTWHYRYYVSLIPESIRSPIFICPL